MYRLLSISTLLIAVCAVAAQIETKVLTLDGSQLEQNIVLNTEKMKTEYQDQQVASTCYRSVQQGTKQECYTPTHQECVPASHEECGYEQHQECGYEPDRQECGYGPSRQECGYEPDRQECGYGPSTRDCQIVPGPQVCSTRYTRECKDERQCQVVNGQRECRSHEVCVQVPHQDCHAGPSVRECRDVPGSYSCHTVSGDYSCHTVSGNYECHTVSGDYTCHTEYGAYKCETVRDPDACHTVSDPQVCQTVPNIVQEAYACTKTIKVPVQVKDFDVQAKIRVLMAELPKDVQVSEKLNLSLSDDQLLASLGVNGKPDNKTIWYLNKDITSNRSGKLKTIEALLKIAALPVAVLRAPISVNPKIALNGEVLSIDIPEVKYSELYKVSFDLLKKKSLGSKEVHIVEEIALADLKPVVVNGTTHLTVELKDLGLEPGVRKSGKYTITVAVTAQVDVIDIVNKEAIPKVLSAKTELEKVKIGK